MLDIFFLLQLSTTMIAYDEPRVKCSNISTVPKQFYPNKN